MFLKDAVWAKYTGLALLGFCLQVTLEVTLKWELHTFHGLALHLHGSSQLLPSQWCHLLWKRQEVLKVQVGVWDPVPHPMRLQAPCRNMAGLPQHHPGPAGESHLSYCSERHYELHHPRLWEPAAPRHCCDEQRQQKKKSWWSMWPRTSGRLSPFYFIATQKQAAGVSALATFL